MMPLTPKHLLFTQVGDKFGDSKELSEEETMIINDILLSRAFRYVFSVRIINRVSKYRKRIVDKELFDAEDAFWREWKIK
jgi:hypothetical protein